MSVTISNEQIAAFVHEILQNPNNNLALIPDALEQKVYETIVHSVVSMVVHVVETFQVQLLGHRIQFSIEPLPTFVAPRKILRKRKKHVKKTLQRKLYSSKRRNRAP